MLDLLLERVGPLAVILAIPLVVIACSDDDKPVPDSAVPDSGLDGDSGTDGAADAPSPQEQKLVILHTNDLHEHLMGFGPNADYTPASTGDGTKGGIARLAAKIKAERAAATAPLLLLDSGDFLMGSIFTWLDADKAPTMMLLQDLGYDAVTLGNHEFDWSLAGLVLFLDAAVKAGFKVPIVASNLKFDASDPGDDKLEALVISGTIVTKLVKTLDNGLKVGIFGVMGDEAATLSAEATKPLTFDSAKDAVADVAKAMIKELREQDKVDLVICLSHSGIKDDGSGEDKLLAADAPGIDVIISGHSHHKLTSPVEVGETLIVQTGKYGEALGRLELTLEEGRVVSHTYELIELDDQVKGDDEVQKKVDGYIQDLDDLLKPAQLTYKTVIAETAFDLAYPHYRDEYFTETILGNVVTDAYLQVYNTLNPTEPADCSIESQGTLRDPVFKGKTGKLWLADIYRAVPLGVGPDGKPGYPLVTFYLHGQDLKSAAELLLLSQGMLDLPPFFLQVGGMQIEYQGGGVPTMSVTSIKIGGQEVDLADKTKCYKVVTNYLLAESLGLVADATQGLLKVEAKDKDCTTAITDMSQRIVDADPAAPGLQELKPWQALVTYMQSFPDTNSNQIPDVPSSYSQLQGRIVAK
jgi:5'-nucleotidase